MKNKKMTDISERYNKIKFHPIIDYVEINGTRININKPIFAFCGLNGAKKTTTILSIAKMFNNEIELRKDLLLNCKTTINNHEVDNTANIDSKLINDSKFCLYSNDLVFKYKKFAQQENLHEILEQYEPIIFEKKDIIDINFYLGKDYKNVILYEIDDNDDFNLYFEIEEDVKYDNSTMGTGELSFLILYYFFFRYNESLILLDEPEMFLSIPTQRKINTLFRCKAIESKDTIIYSTHSFFLLDSLDVNSISYISNNSTLKKLEFCSPSCTVEKEIMGKYTIIGTLFFEDTKGLLFLQALLREYNKEFLITQYNLMQLTGYGDICKELKRVNDDLIDYDFMGVFDGDKKDDPQLNQNDFKWPHVFLPLSINLEEAIREHYLHNMEMYNNNFKIPSSEAYKFISSHQGQDCHDWYQEFLTTFTMIDDKSLIAFYVRNVDQTTKTEFEEFVSLFESKITRCDNIQM